MMTRSFVLCFVLSIICVSIRAQEYIVNCYFGTWAVYRQSFGKFEVENIDPNLCNQLSYAFFGLSEDGQIMMLDRQIDIDKGFLKKTISLKQINPKLKVIASVGGWKEGSSKYSKMAANPSKRRIFVNSVYDFLVKHNFDGFDLDWEYPTERDGSPADRGNFVILLKELRQKLQNKFTIGIAVGAAPSKEKAYDVKQISNYVDYINLMTYDFGGSWDNALSFNAPLRGQQGNNVFDAVSFWINQGAPSRKLLLGLPFYGRTFTLANPSNTKPGSSHRGAGKAGPYTLVDGTLGYNEICEKVWTKKWDSTHEVPYAFKGDQWLSYDNEESIEKKIEFLKSKNLGGAMIWSIETDDFRGNCGPKYPLLSKVNSVLNNNVPHSEELSNNIYENESYQPEQPEEQPDQPEQQPEEQPYEPHQEQYDPLMSSPTFDCSRDGFFSHPTDCNMYYRCFNNEMTVFNCPSTLFFDETISSCNYPQFVQCKS